MENTLRSLDLGVLTGITSIRYSITQRIFEKPYIQPMPLNQLTASFAKQSKNANCFLLNIIIDTGIPLIPPSKN
jgi:hypothetical protein